MRQQPEVFHDIPIFPLPNLVLFPRTVLPLHIFEPRYRQMVAHCLEKELPIGIVLLKPGSQKEEAGTEPTYEIGSAGKIARHQKLDDGRYNILLSGRYRFQIKDPLPREFLFRQATVESIPEWVPEAEESDHAHGSLLASIEELTRGQQEEEAEENGREILSQLDFEALVNTLCSVLRLDPQTRQELLELDDLRDRAKSILDFMDEQLSLRRLADRYRCLRPEDPSLN
ncbi:MAG: LON peptidase substrate-binding domain-containing protein [Acidobacteriota bacterium]